MRHSRDTCPYCDLITDMTDEQCAAARIAHEELMWIDRQLDAIDRKIDRAMKDAADIERARSKTVSVMKAVLGIEAPPAVPDADLWDRLDR